MHIRALIADDETEMRFVLRKALEGLNNVTVLDEARDGAEAVSLVEKHKPDCIFLDVEMPGCDGVSAARQIFGSSEKTKIVFVTAHQEYMPQAFEIYAFDYIVKPFRQERLKETVDKMIAYKEPEKVMLKLKEGFELVEADSIIMIQREKRATAVITRNGKFHVNSSLSELMDILPDGYFIRSHKSYIINYRQINKISPYGRWTYVCGFKSISEDALITAEKVKELETRFNIV